MGSDLVDAEAIGMDSQARATGACPAGRTAFFFLAIIVLLFSAGSASAGDAGSQAVNWAYQSSLGDGAFVETTRNVQIYNLPFSYTLRNVNDAGWALKFRLPLTVGIYNVETADRDIDVDVMSAVPGIELRMPVSGSCDLVPFAGFGAGKDSTGGNERYLYSLGIRQYVYARSGPIDFTFGNVLRRDGFSAKDGGRDGALTSLGVGLDVRFPMGFNFPKSPGYMSGYGIFRHVMNGTSELYTEGTDFQVEDQGEIGITLGSVPSWKIWRLPIDRLGIGYLSGGSTSTLRVVFGMPF